MPLYALPMAPLLMPADGDVAAAGEAWAAHWAPPMLRMLRSPHDLLRQNVATYALPQLLKLDPSAMARLLRALLDDVAAGGEGDEGAVSGPWKASP